MADNPKGIRGARGPRESVSTQFRFLKICRILLDLLPDEPSAMRVELRTMMGELRAELGEHPTRASETDVAWENHDGPIEE